MAEANPPRPLHDAANKLQTLSTRLHIDQAIRNCLDDVRQAVQHARTLQENTEQLDIQGESLKLAEKPEEANAIDLVETLKQTRNNFSNRYGISELQDKVQNLREYCRRQVDALCAKGWQIIDEIETTKQEIQGLEEKIDVEKEHAADFDASAKDLNGKSSLIEDNPTIGNVKDLSNFINEAESLRDAKLSTANSLKEDITRKKSEIDRLETETDSLKERIGALKDVISGLEDVDEKLELSFVQVPVDIEAAIQRMDNVLREARLARSDHVQQLNAKERRTAKRQLENIKKALEGVREAF